MASTLSNSIASTPADRALASRGELVEDELLRACSASHAPG
jgi:hypothetical protein